MAFWLIAPLFSHSFYHSVGVYYAVIVYPFREHHGQEK